MNTIQATELRIGNFIGMNLEEYPNNFFTALEIGETMKVYEGLITLKGASIKRVETSFMYVDDFEPIPLNEDWLVRFGFEKDINTSWFRIGYFAEMEDVSNRMIIGYNTVSNRLGCYQEGDANGIFAQKTFQYVHQLQNLYFSLTGTELTLTDK